MFPFVFILPGGLVLFSMFIGLLVVLVNMNYASVRAAAHLSSKHSILEYVTGKYLAIQLCKVHWEWDEPQVVGKTMTFKVKVGKFHQATLDL